MKLYVFLLVTALAGFCDADPEIGLCENYRDVQNDMFDKNSTGSTYYVKYITINDPDINKSFEDKLDSNSFNYTRIGKSNKFNLTFITIDKDGIIYIEFNTLTFDEATGKASISDGKLKYNIMSYKPNSFALVYTCALKGNRKYIMRMVLATNLNIDVTQALEEDRKRNFTNQLVKLPYKHKDLLLSPNKLS